MHKLARFFIPMVSALAMPFMATAQLSEGGLPHSAFLPGLKSANVPQTHLQSPDVAKLIAEDSLNPVPFRYALAEKMELDLRIAGKPDRLSSPEGTIWRFSFHSPGSKSLQIAFSRFHIPPGATLFAYGPDYAQMAGAFTWRNNQPGFTLADMPGDQVTIEYFEPIDAAFPGEIIIGSVSKAYRDIFTEFSGDDFVNINCPAGADLQLIKHSVCKITFREGASSYICSGALINNLRNDGTPYFLTANHCLHDSAAAASLVTYFNFENVGCGGEVMNGKTLSGSSLLTTSDLSDYTLLLLNDVPPPSYLPYYAAWDARNLAAESTNGIHHPQGLPKMLSIDFDSPVSNASRIQWQGNTTSPIGSHWQVDFDNGITAGGSSGSPLFSEEGRILGQLHGGDDRYDFYGKLSYSFTKPAATYPQLKAFLDPDLTGELVSGGYYPTTNPPDAFFVIPMQKACLNAPFKLADRSAFAPYDLEWQITPSSFAFINGTNAQSSEPEVSFSAPGDYTIALSVTNVSGTDVYIPAETVSAGEDIDPYAIAEPDSELCACDFTEFRLTGMGALTYNWSIPVEEQERFQLSNSTGEAIRISPAPGLKIDSTLTLSVKLKGIYGVCTDSVVIPLRLVRPANDNVELAYLVSPGVENVFSNRCATIEPGEPIPPFNSCTSQYSWCNEYGTGEDIVENSVWFTFIAPITGYVSISSSGVDNQLALYSANSATDILMGNYTLLGANDDRSTSDFNPLIRLEQVTPGIQYWIQADGSGGGTEGEFSLLVNATTFTSSKGLSTDEWRVYPQPATDFLTISRMSNQDKPLRIMVYNGAGMGVLEYYGSPGEDLKLDVSGLSDGVYLVNWHSNKESGSFRFIKQSK